MLSSVLNSERAIDVNIAIMRTFVKLRQMEDEAHRDTVTRKNFEIASKNFGYDTAEAVLSRSLARLAP